MADPLDLRTGVSFMRRWKRNGSASCVICHAVIVIQAPRTTNPENSVTSTAQLDCWAKRLRAINQLLAACPPDGPLKFY